MFSFFRKKKKAPIVEGTVPALTTDIHSHLLPGIDDGSENLEDSIEMIKSFHRLGYRKLITTPHIMGDFYQNTPEIIHEQLTSVKEELKKHNVEIALEAAAEYYLDERFIERLKKEEQLMTFGDRFLLFETSYMNECSFLDQAIFLMQAQGYKPVMAHPERYVYLFHSYDELVRIKEKGVYLQINMNSLAGYYSGASKNMAERLVNDNLVSFIGSDCHKLKHVDLIPNTLELPYCKKALQLGVKNNSL